MTDFIIKKLPYDLTSNAGLALVGQYMKRLGISNLVDRKFPVGVGGIANSDILKSYLGLLVQGKNDFDAIEEFRGDDFFTRALDVSTVPSSSTLRQRMDTHAPSWFELASEFNLALLSAKYASGPVDFGALPCGYMAVDWDTFVMNNSDTQKEAVGRTYQGVDGFTPSATYLGSLGYCLELALRPGVQHSALETELNLERVLPMAAKLTPLPLLFRADSGLCSLKIMQEVNAQAAAQGYALAQYNLGWMYESGQGVAKDHAEAIRLYGLAAAQGNVAARFNLDDMLAPKSKQKEPAPADKAEPPYNAANAAIMNSIRQRDQINRETSNSRFFGN